jgi:hypothetical protein
MPQYTTLRSETAPVQFQVRQKTASGKVHKRGLFDKLFQTCTYHLMTLNAASKQTIKCYCES